MRTSDALKQNDVSAVVDECIRAIVFARYTAALTTFLAAATNKAKIVNHAHKKSPRTARALHLKTCYF